MRQNKYYNIDYWNHQISKQESIWQGLFENKPINEDSLIIAPSILNSYSNHAVDGFVVYPNPKSVLGFLQYIYLPTAFSSIFDHSEESGYIIANDLIDFFEHRKEKHPDKAQLIEKMEELYVKLDQFWSQSEEKCLESLLTWTTTFNEEWINIKGVMFTFAIFTSPKQLVDEIIRVYEEDLDIEMLEADLDINKEEFIRLASEDIYTNPFMQRKFTEILTNRLNITF